MIYESNRKGKRYIIVSIKRDDVVFIDYIDRTIGKTVDDEMDRIVADKGEPLSIDMNMNGTGLIELEYWNKKYKLHEVVMICYGYD